MKIAVAMSGGVDSSVAAALCVEKYGKENAFGVTMKLFCYGKAEVGDKSCCSVDAINDAKKVCAELGIPHYVINLEKEFEKSVVKNFLEEYKKGHTPNPCVRCNKIIKFDLLLKKAKSLGADMLATGHYARIEKKHLMRGKDTSKDQSYFLYGIKKEELSSILFPVGVITKTETREIAKKLNLKTAGKKESQEVCFVTGKTENYLKEKIKNKSGEILNINGEIIGKHNGISFYTIGQRKGLGGGSHRPVYVIGVDAKENQVIIGEEKDLYARGLTVTSVNWLENVKFPLKCTAKIRYRMEDADCVLDERGRVVFGKTQRAITLGQSIVFYKNDIVLGGGIISD